MSEKTEKALHRAIYKMLRPLVRLLMRHGVSYRSFADLARHAYVDAARADFPLPGRKQSNARTAVLTGINRKDIAKLDDRPHPLSDAPNANANPAAKVITGWLNNFRYHNATGQPATLPLDSQDSEPSFTELVREYSSDVPVRALLDELVRIEAVGRCDDQVKLLATGYIPLQDMAENMRIFGTAAADLIRTMDHNISGEKPGPFIQRTVSYQIPPELLLRVRDRASREGERFLLQINDWLAQYESELTGTEEARDGEVPEAQRVRAGVGIYYFEQPANEADPGGTRSEQTEPRKGEGTRAIKGEATNAIKGE